MCGSLCSPVYNLTTCPVLAAYTANCVIKTFTNWILMETQSEPPKTHFIYTRIQITGLTVVA